MIAMFLLLSLRDFDEPTPVDIAEVNMVYDRRGNLDARMELQRAAMGVVSQWAKGDLTHVRFDVMKMKDALARLA